MKVLLKNGEIQDLDLDKINSSRESSDYKKEISEILLYIKKNSNNEEKEADLLTYLWIDKNNKSKDSRKIKLESFFLCKCFI